MMGISTQTITVDLSKQLTRPQVVRLGQGDKSGTTLVADIYDNGAAYNLNGKTARFSMRAPDGASSYSVVASSYNGNKATFNLDETYAAAIVGKTDTAYIEVLSGSTVICSTSRITVIVYRSASQGLPVAGAYSDSLSEAISSAQSAASTANSAASNANTKATRAENAATAANNAADSVNAAKDAANAAASAANSAASAANDAASSANDAASSANDAAVAANSATDAANSAETSRASAESNRNSTFAAMQRAFADMQEQVMPPATTSTIGGVIVGDGLNVTSDGTLSFEAGDYLTKDEASEIYATTTDIAGKADAIHFHNASDVTDGTLAVARGGTGVSTAAAERGRLGLGSTTGALPIANGGTGASNAADARTALGLGSLATLSLLDLLSLAEDGSARDSSARSSGANYRIDITLEAMSGYKPIAVIAVSADSANARLRGFDLDGVSTGGTPKVKTYWNASGDMSANTVTYNVQVLMMKTTLP